MKRRKSRRPALGYTDARHGQEAIKSLKEAQKHFGEMEAAISSHDCEDAFRHYVVGAEESGFAAAHAEAAGRPQVIGPVYGASKSFMRACVIKRRH
jgi:hypothetical protein